jgi:gliding motility-associated-like protein
MDGVSGNIHTILPDNQYSVSAYNYGCTASDDLDVYETRYSIKLKNTGILCSQYNQFPIITVTGAINTKWLLSGDTLREFIPEVRGWIYETSLSPEGCVVTDSIYIEENCPHVITVPSAFSPNHDGINDKFYCSMNSYSEGSLSIYNRTGERVYYSGNLSGQWDGTYKNIDCMQGMYNYFISYYDEAGIQRKVAGCFALIR